MNLTCNLCEPSSVVVTVYNTAAERVAIYDEQGESGANIYSLNISSFSHGVYFILIQSTGPSGGRKSNTMKFAVVR
jgi:hypothetical protein